MEEKKLYLIGKDWKDGKIVKHKGTYDDFEDAKAATDRGYAVYDEAGNELYRNKGRKFFLLLLFIVLFFIVTFGATLSIYNWITDPGPSPTEDDRYNYYKLEDGTIIRYDKDELIIPYTDGKIVIPPGGGKITFPDGSIREVPEGTIILPDGTIIIPDSIPPTIDEYGNVHTEDDKTNVVSPKCGEREVPKGTIIRPNGTLIIPTKGSRVYVDEHNYVRVVGSAIVVWPDCTELKVSDGAVITPGTDKDSGGDTQTIVDPNGGNKPNVDDNGNIITTDDNGKVINDCGTQTVPKGTIIRPDGTIVIPSAGSSVRIDNFNNIIVTGSATVIMPDCTKYTVSNGTVITPGDNDGDTGTINNEDHNPGTIIDPNGGDKPTVDDNGNITVPDDGGKIITPNCGERNISAGTLVRPDGTIYIPHSGSKVYVNSKNEVVVEGKATMIKTDCSETTVTGTVPKDEEPVKCNPAKQCCSGDTYATNKNCTKPPIVIPPVDPGDGGEEPKPIPKLAILYTDGNELKVTDISPGDPVGTKLFKVKNVGEGNITYNILWTDVITSLVNYQDFVVTIKRNGNVIQTQRVLPRKNELMLGDIQLNVGEMHEYELYFEYLERGVPQDEDQNKMFSTSIKVEGYRYLED